MKPSQIQVMPVSKKLNWSKSPFCLLVARISQTNRIPHIDWLPPFHPRQYHENRSLGTLGDLCSPHGLDCLLDRSRRLP